MNQPQVSIFPAEMTTALYRRAIASAWRQKALTETGCDQYGPHSLTVERIEMAIALHIECALINEYGEAQGAAAALALLTDMLEPSLLTAPPVLTVRGCEVMAELYPVFKLAGVAPDYAALADFRKLPSPAALHKMKIRQEREELQKRNRAAEGI